MKGIQIGLYCCAGEGDYLQLGLITYRPEQEKGLKRLSPLIGWSRSKKRLEEIVDDKSQKEI